MKHGNFSKADSGAIEMRKFNRARSNFFDPIAKWSDGVFLVRPYAYANAFGLDSNQVRQMCKDGFLPHLYDGDTYLILIDSRDFGDGGQFTQPRSAHSHPLFPRWKGKRHER